MIKEADIFDWQPSDLLEVNLPNADAFLKIKETLTRVGIASKKEKVLYPSCYILHKKGRYYITHFKELFLLEGKSADLTHDDIARRNTIAGLLVQWGLCSFAEQKERETVPVSTIKVIPFKEKPEWKISPKFMMLSDRKRLKAESTTA